MTDKELIAALRCCEDQDKTCSDCAFLLVSNCVESMNNLAADLIKNQQNHIAALVKVNGSLKDAISRRDKQIEDMKQWMVQEAKTVAVKEHPCVSCGVGWGESSTNGVKTCEETCERLKAWAKKEG